MKALLVTLLAATAMQNGSSDAPEAAAVFEARQDDLISLAGKLGMLHRLNQLCPEQYQSSTVYRDHMIDIIEGESPPRLTRESMINAFNQSFRQISAIHRTCSRRAEDDFRREALATLTITDRLYAPLQNR